MKAYWDSSALIEACREPGLRQRLVSERGFSRRHSLAEVFSALTGKPHFRLDTGKAAALLKDLVRDLDFVELTTEEILEAGADAEALGVRGGRIHDLLHARAALKSGATVLLTLDQNDFDKLTPGLNVERV